MDIDTNYTGISKAHGTGILGEIRWEMELFPLRILCATEVRILVFIVINSPSN